MSANTYPHLFFMFRHYSETEFHFRFISTYPNFLQAFHRDVCL